MVRTWARSPEKLRWMMVGPLRSIMKLWPQLVWMISTSISGSAPPLAPRTKASAAAKLWMPTMKLVHQLDHAASPAGSHVGHLGGHGLHDGQGGVEGGAVAADHDGKGGVGGALDTTTDGSVEEGSSPLGSVLGDLLGSGWPDGAMVDEELSGTDCREESVSLKEYLFHGGYIGKAGKHDI